ncbi:MAG: hypothetical protein AAF317_20595 [Pseudomonadota bacterium]
MEILMKLIGRLWICLGLLLIGVPAKAEDLPGADDPRLQAAINDWLATEPKAIFTLVDIADRGNVTAQLLVTKIRQLGYDGQDLAHLNWRERRRLMTGRSDRAPAAGWQLEASLPDYPVDPVWGSSHPRDEEAWQQYATLLLALGEREAALRSLWTAYSQFGFSALAFQQSVVELNDYEQFFVWYLRWSMAQLIAVADKTGDGDTFRAEHKLTHEPWTTADEAEFQAALADARLAAIQAQHWRNFSQRIEFHDHTHHRSAELLEHFWLRDLPVDERPDADELEAAGAILVAEAERATTLRPFLNICRRECPENINFCMYSGVVASKGLQLVSYLDTPLEAIIPQARWHRSRRAEAVYIAQVGHWPGFAKSRGLEWLELDRCLLDAAQRTALQREPAKDSVAE